MIILDENQAPLLGKQKTLKEVTSKLFHDWVTLAIMFAQISTCIFAWTFVGCMMHKTITLPDTTATWIQSHPSEINVVVTLVSTILGLINSALLGRAVQHALIHRLSYAPLRLYTMIECTKLAQRSISVNFERRHLSWTLLSVGWVGLMSFLTTAWSSLLAPESVVIYHDLRGNEVDFLNPSVSNLFSEQGNILSGPQPAPGFNLTPGTFPLANLYSLIDITASLTDAGFWAAAAKNPLNNKPTNFISIFGSPYVGNISTGGIYPTANLSAPPSFVDLGIGSLNPSHQGLSRTYNVTQHGFTANISCQTPTPNDPAITLNLTNSALISAGDSLTWAVDTFSWSIDCSSEVQYSTIGVSIASGIFSGRRDPLQGENGLLMTSVCFGQSFTGPSNQSFLVLFDSSSNSSYAFFTPTICEVTPLVTTVQATYDTTGIINVIQPPLRQRLLPNPNNNNNTGVLMWLPALTIWTSFVRSQALTANMMGDRLLDPTFSNIDPNLVIENYLRGMMEYLGSFMAQSVSLVYNPDMTVPFNGTINVRTFGWTFHAQTHGLSLAAITLVALLTLAAGAFAMTRINRDDGATKDQKLQAVPTHSFHDFNPTEAMDILLASSTGDLARVLSESDRGGDHDGRNSDGGLRVMLGATEKGRPLLKTVTVNVTSASADLDRHASISSRDEVRLGVGSSWSSTDAANHDGSVELGIYRRVGGGKS